MEQTASAETGDLISVSSILACQCQAIPALPILPV
jgi:hypothetical protein